MAQKGSPAPGLSGNFTFFPDDSEALALMPDGNVTFKATATDPAASQDGIWFGNASNLHAVAVANLSALTSLLGAGYTLVGPCSENVEVNAKGELAFAASLAGPGLNNTNSEFVLAGTPANLRVVERPRRGGVELDSGRRLQTAVSKSQS